MASHSYFNEEKVVDGSCLVVFTVADDIDLFDARIETYLPEGSVKYFREVVKPKGEQAIKNWMQHQVYLSLGFFLSACAAMNIDSTPMEGIDTEAYDKLLDVKGYKTLFAVTIGYRDPNDANQPAVKPKSRLPLSDVVVSI